MVFTKTPWVKPVLIGAVVVVVAGVIAFATLGMDTISSWFHKKEEKDPAKESKPAAELVRDDKGLPISPPTIRLTERVANSLGIKNQTIVEAITPKNLRALPPQMGTLAYDNDRLFAVTSRFAGEVSEIMECPPKQRGSVPLPPNMKLPKSVDVLNPPKEGKRLFTIGDTVKKGDLLAIVWSKDLGDKKAALIDAIIDLRRDTEKMLELEKLYYEGAASKASYLEAQRAVRLDLSRRNSAERTLRIWKLDDKEIDAIKKEAETIQEDKRDPKKEMNWARVEVRALNDGVIVEKNTHVGGWVDPSNYNTPMFRVADLSKLQVWLNPVEEYLPVLQEFLKKPLATPLNWEIHLQADPRAKPLNGALLRVNPSIEPTQRTALVIGVVDNPESRLLVGQFVTATIQVPLEDGLVEIPTAALNEEKGQSVVFVQPDKDKLEFTMRPVSVAYRFKDVVYVRSKIEHHKDGEKVQPLLPGERVVTESIVELTKALRDLRAKEELAHVKK
jgi:cobalt-zinc-cadmium efflux system membrane fusion protein